MGTLLFFCSPPRRLACYLSNIPDSILLWFILAVVPIVKEHPRNSSRHLRYLQSPLSYHGTDTWRYTKTRIFRSLFVLLWVKTSTLSLSDFFPVHALVQPLLTWERVSLTPPCVHLLWDEIFLDSTWCILQVRRRKYLTQKLSKRDSEVTGLRSYVSPSWQLPDEYFEKVSQGFKAGWDLI